MSKYTFLPWVRHGIANEMGIPTTPAARTELPLEIKVGSEMSSFTISKVLEFVGPGDIVGINEVLAVSRLHPRPGTLDFPPNLLPFIEFYEEDFPWRYSPARPGADNKLMPWLTLFLLKEGEFAVKYEPGRPLPSVVVTDPGCQMLKIPATKSWAWAHVQVNKDWSGNDAAQLGEKLTDLLKNEPDAAFSRVIGPRKLEPKQEYHAFLVPTFKSGKQAGLGQPIAVGSATEVAWAQGSTDNEFPFYLRWSFTTAEAGDFETLLRKIKPNQDVEMDFPEMDITNLLQRIQPPGKDRQKLTQWVKMPALLTPDPTLLPWPDPKTPGDKAIQTELANRLNKTPGSMPTPVNANLIGDPVLDLLPTYGTRQAGKKTFDTQKINEWANTLNLDPRFRVLANMGADIVRENQDDFLEKAWSLALPQEPANDRLRCAQLAIAVTPRLIERHLPGLSLNSSAADQAQDLAVLRSTHGQVTNGNTTVAMDVKDSRLTAAATDPAMRRAMLFGNRWKKTAPNFKAPAPGIAINQLNTTLKIGKAKLPIYQGTVPLALGVTRASEQTRVNNIQATLVLPQLPAATVSNLLDALGKQLAPETAVVKWVRGAFGLDLTVTGTEGLKPLVPDAVEFQVPLFDFFKKISPGLVLPQLKNMPDNSVTLMEVNRQVLEAVLVGANHELDRLLAWQKFPAAGRSGTFFRHFWDTNDHQNVPLGEVKPIQQWVESSKLGDAAHIPTGNQPPGIFLLLRGELFRKFPDVVVFAQKAKNGKELGPANNRRYPKVRGQFDPDILALGFDLEEAEAKGSGTGTDPGWFFCFLERPGQIQLGMDETTKLTSPSNPNDLAWWPFFSLENYLDPDKVFSSWEDANVVKWGKDAAHIAGALVQKQAMLAVHATDLLL